jgi:hypothetical protein
MPSGLALAQSGCRRAVAHRLFVPICLAAALLLRLGWILAVDARPIDDFSWYYDRAVGLAQGEGLTVKGVPTAYWPVGYPLMLAALFVVTGPSLLAAKLLNLLLAMAIVWYSYRVAGRLFASEAASRLALLLVAFHPNHIAYTSLTASETPFLFLMLLGLLLLLRRKGRPGTALLAGAVFGLGCLTKPTMLFVPATFFALSLLARFRWRTVARLGLVYAALALVVLPWTLRNYRVFGRPLFVVTSGGINLLIGNNPLATGGYGGVDPETEALVDSRKDELAREDAARAIARRYIIEHPWRTIGRMPAKLWHLYAKDVEGFYWNELATGAREGPVLQRPMVGLKIIGELYYLALLAAFAAGVFRFYVAGRPPFPRPALSALGLGIIAYFSLVMMVLFGSSRLHFPLIPCFALYAGAWLASRLAPAASLPAESARPAA